VSDVVGGDLNVVSVAHAHALGSSWTASGGAVSVTGNTASGQGTVNVMNPYVAMYWIMKVA
jgi:hypothetical protein